MFIYLAELPRPMKIKPFMMYLVGKYKQEAMRDNYLLDCLWAMATDMRFAKDKEPSLSRWHELAYPKKEKKAPKVTKEMVKARFRRLIG